MSAEQDYILKEAQKIGETLDLIEFLLQTALDRTIVDQAEFTVFRNLLLYRHRHIHGYGYMLDESLLKDLAQPVPNACRQYLQRLLNYS